MDKQNVKIMARNREAYHEYFVEEEMEAGIYRKKFTVSKDCVNPVITFLGVCSSLTLYVNGQYVGYSEGSHHSAEFNLKGIVNEGENELLALKKSFKEDVSRIGISKYNEGSDISELWKMWGIE